MSSKGATAKAAVYAPAGIDPAATLRPEMIARIELLRIVWRPGADAGKAIDDAAKLEQYVLSGNVKPASQ